MYFKGTTKGLLALLAGVCVWSNEAPAQTTVQSPEQRVAVTVRPAQTVEERVADEFKEKELRRVAEENLAAVRSAEIAANTPKAMLSRAQTIFISSGTSFFEPIQLQNALRQRTEFDLWQLAVIDGWDKRNTADIIIEVDRPLFTYTFTYQITARSTAIVLASGKITAFDGNAAAPRLAGKIIDEIKKARGASKAKT
ncbi:MAG: hypothetical protein MSG64_15920 [Pyrinomonadaceae bacterium MAG19_C2-C3]|nr:hypothetical protein [Pyrinomonadaceae bacterium MAG19_C2-C3]